MVRGVRLGPEANPLYGAVMNAMDPKSEDLATLHYGDGEFAVMKPGRYVLCAVTGRRVPIEALRYWDAETQEAYAGAAEAFQAWQARQAAHSA